VAVKSTMNKRYVTISVDDGHTSDSRTAELLCKYGLQATFYIPAFNPERPVMSEDSIRELAQEFEIGGHTLNHVTLKGLPPDQAWSEINDGKNWLEDVLGRRVVAFCYPRGKFNTRIAGQVRKAGFAGARTCSFHLNDFPADCFAWGVSTHAYSHSRILQIRQAVLARNLSAVWHLYRTHNWATDWEQHFGFALDYVEQHGGIAHLYLHSWEIDELGQWGRLESIFRSIAQRDNLIRATNGELFQLWKHNHNGRT